MRSGALPFSTQSTIAVRQSYMSVAGPPAQCAIPGTGKTRTNSAALPPDAAFTSSHHFIVSWAEKTGSLRPCGTISLPP